MTTDSDRPYAPDGDDMTWTSNPGAFLVQAADELTAHLGLAFDAPHGTGKTRPATEVIEVAELRLRIAELEAVLNATPMGAIAYLCHQAPAGAQGEEWYAWGALERWFLNLLSARAGAQP